MVGIVIGIVSVTVSGCSGVGVVGAGSVRVLGLGIGAGMRIANDYRFAIYASGIELVSGRGVGVIIVSMSLSARVIGIGIVSEIGIDFVIGVGAGVGIGICIQSVAEISVDNVHAIAVVSDTVLLLALVLALLSAVR